METRDLVMAWVEGLRTGNFFETFDGLVAEDVVVRDFGEAAIASSPSNPPPVDGKTSRKAAILRFYMNSAFKVTNVASILVEGDMSAIEYSADVTTSGVGTRKIRMVVLQTWKDGQVIRQHNYTVYDK